VKDQLTHKQIARLARRAVRTMDYAQALASELPSELGTEIAENFAESALLYLAEAAADLAKIKRSLHLERCRKKESLREYLARKAREPRTIIHVATPLPVRPYRPETALATVGREERAA